MKRQRRTPSSFGSAYGKLEARNLLASIFHNPDNGILYIAGDSNDNVGQVSVSDGDVVAEIDGESFSGDSSTVTDIVFLGRDGNDTFTNLSDRSSNMYGGLGNDTLIGGGGDDNLVGGWGSDTIEGHGGDDRIVGAGGRDTLEGGDGDDWIFGTAGTNTIYGGSGNDVIFGSDDVDNIFGEAGADKIFARGGDDIIYTGAGGVEGGTFEQGDLAHGQDGNDRIYGFNGLDIFYGGNGDDVLIGGTGENRLHGQAGDDVLVGGDKSDYLAGADGDDSFHGGGGLDFFKVGNGIDTIVYTSVYSPAQVSVTTNGSSVETRVQNELVSDATWVQFADRTIDANQSLYSTQDAISFFKLNGYRTEVFEDVLSKPSDLAEFANDWSLEMASQNQLVNFTQNDVASLLIGGRTIFGQNIATVSDIGQTDAEIANYFHGYWQHDPGFNSNMIDGDFSEVGIGIVKSNAAWWATQIFMG